MVIKIPPAPHHFSRPVSMDSMHCQVLFFLQLILALKILFQILNFIFQLQRNWIILSLLNWFSGVGILSVPYALSLGGWLSLILLFAIAIATFYSGLLIQRCMDMDSDIRTYTDIGSHAFGNKGRILVSVFMNMELFLVATDFLILEGDTLYNLFPDTGFEIAGIKIEGKQIFVIIVAIVILPSVCLDNLSLLSYISASGVFASVIILGSVLWTGVFDGIGFHQKGTLINWNGIPTAASLYAFCYGAHPVFPTIHTSMRNKSQFSNVSRIKFFEFSNTIVHYIVLI